MGRARASFLPAAEIPLAVMVTASPAMEALATVVVAGERPGGPVRVRPWPSKSLSRC